MENNVNNSFNYTYSAKQQEEIKSIRKKYIPQEEDKLQRLKMLDSAVYGKATAFSLAAGIVGILALGLGMSCCLVWQNSLFAPGVAVGMIGIVLVILAYPLYNKTLARERKKAAPEIMRLTDELLK